MTDTVKDMSQSSNVLKSLRILGLEEMLKLSQVLQVKQVPLKKAAGEDLVVWDEAPEKKRHSPPQEAKLLEFPKERSSSARPTPLIEPEVSEEAEEKEVPFLYSSEMMLWQRELSKESEALMSKKGATTGYKKATEMYVVKSQDREGKEKIRFASTNGVLVNKKQA